MSTQPEPEHVQNLAHSIAKPSLPLEFPIWMSVTVITESAKGRHLGLLSLSGTSALFPPTLVNLLFSKILSNVSIVLLSHSSLVQVLGILTRLPSFLFCFWEDLSLKLGLYA
jgi:hypothetical protein